MSAEFHHSNAKKSDYFSKFSSVMYALRITGYSHIQIYEYAIETTNHIAYFAKVHIQRKKNQRRESGGGQNCWCACTKFEAHKTEVVWTLLLRSHVSERLSCPHVGKYMIKEEMSLQTGGGLSMLYIWFTILQS